VSRRNLELVVNGQPHQALVEPHWTLLQVLRDELGLLGTKANCLEAECGVCTVLLDGKSVASCILLAEQARGRAVTTIEGIGDPEHLHPLQAAFIECGAVQCGYCIPGMILTAKSFLDEQPGRRPSREEIREALAGTLCRCTGYRKIVDAVALAAERLADRGASSAASATSVTSAVSGSGAAAVPAAAGPSS
jgi:aerobic-type carbon monoxide dehydrogenase small subunit (CoxS/CutS family)